MQQLLVVIPSDQFGEWVFGWQNEWMFPVLRDRSVTEPATDSQDTLINKWSEGLEFR